MPAENSDQALQRSYVYDHPPSIFPDLCGTRDGRPRCSIMKHEPGSKRPHVLIVEDEPLVRMVTVASLEELGRVTLEAARGDEAIEFLRGISQLDGCSPTFKCQARLTAWSLLIWSVSDGPTFRSSSVRDACFHPRRPSHGVPNLLPSRIIKPISSRSRGTQGVRPRSLAVNGTVLRTPISKPFSDDAGGPLDRRLVA